MADPWEWDGTCSNCGSSVQWEGEEPEIEEDAICHACKADAFEEVKMNLAAMTVERDELKLKLGACRDAHDKDEKMLLKVSAERDLMKATLIIIRKELPSLNPANNEARSDGEVAEVWKIRALLARGRLALIRKAMEHREVRGGELCVDLLGEEPR